MADEKWEVYKRQTEENYLRITRLLFLAIILIVLSGMTYVIDGHYRVAFIHIGTLIALFCFERSRTSHKNDLLTFLNSLLEMKEDILDASEKALASFEFLKSEKDRRIRKLTARLHVMHSLCYKIAMNISSDSSLHFADVKQITEWTRKQIIEAKKTNED